MSIGLVGRKSGMTRVFTEAGSSIPVTVVEVLPNRVTQVKTADSDGYSAIQITTGSKKSNLLDKSEAGHFAKAGVEAGRGLWEFRTADAASYQQGSELTVALFTEGAENPDPYPRLICTSTPAARSSFMRASTVFSVGSTISRRRLWVLSSY